MEMHTETQSRSEIAGENAMERFIRQTRTLFAQESDLDKR